MIDFSICKNCGRPIFFDWKGAHHVRQDDSLPVAQFGGSDMRIDFSRPQCDRPEEAEEEE